MTDVPVNGLEPIGNRRRARTFNMDEFKIRKVFPCVVRCYKFSVLSYENGVVFLRIGGFRQCLTSIRYWA